MNDVDMFLWNGRYIRSDDPGVKDILRELMTPEAVRGYIEDLDYDGHPFDEDAALSEFPLPLNRLAAVLTDGELQRIADMLIDDLDADDPDDVAYLLGWRTPAEWVGITGTPDPAWEEALGGITATSVADGCPVYWFEDADGGRWTNAHLEGGTVRLRRVWPLRGTREDGPMSRDLAAGQPYPREVLRWRRRCRRWRTSSSR